MALPTAQICCTTTAPGIKVSVGPGSTDCIVSTPRDLTGNGLIVSQFIYIAKAGETTFSGTDSQGKELDAAPESSVVAVNGTVIPPSDYTLTPTVLTLSRETYLNDIVTVISFREPDSTGTADRLDDLEERVDALEGNTTIATVTTMNVSTIPDGTTPRAETIQPDFQNITNQYFANWWLYFEIEKVRGEIGTPADLSNFATIAYSDAGDDALQQQINNLTLGGNGTSVDLSNYALLTYVDAADAAIRSDVSNLTLDLSIEQQERVAADAVLQGQIDNITIPDHSNFATISYVDSGDNDTLAAANTFTTNAIAAIPPVDLSDYATKDEVADGYVRKVGGDSMQGPLVMQAQPNTGSRETNRVQTLGVFTNSDSSALRLGTNRDRVYIGDNDTAFNGPVKVDELQDKNGNGVKYEGKTSGPNNIQNRQSVLSITDPIQGGVDQNAADIRTLFQEIQAIAKPLGGGYYYGISVSSVNNGQFHLASGSYATTGTTTLTFHQYDQHGVSRGWGDADPGDYIVLQSRNSDNFGVYEVVRVTQFSDKFAIEVEQVEGKGTHTGDTLVSLYNLAGSGIELNELDQRYLRKDVQQTTTGLLKFQLSTGMCLAAHDDSWQIWRDGTFITARTTFSSNHLVTQNYVSSNFAAKSHNHDGVYSPVGHTHSFSVDDATKSTKGIAYLGQANTGTSTAPSLKSGQLYWNTSTKTLYVGN